MEKRALARRIARKRVGGIQSEATALWHQGVEVRLRQVAGQDLGCAALAPPDFQQMRLAAARRTVKRQPPQGPVGPAVDPGDRVRVAGGDQEILAAQRRPVGEIEGELAHPSSSSSAASRSALVP